MNLSEFLLRNKLISKYHIKFPCADYRVFGDILELFFFDSWKYFSNYDPSQMWQSENIILSYAYLYFLENTTSQIHWLIGLK